MITSKSETLSSVSLNTNFHDVPTINFRFINHFKNIIIPDISKLKPYTYTELIKFTIIQ